MSTVKAKRGTETNKVWYDAVRGRLNNEWEKYDQKIVDLIIGSFVEWHWPTPHDRVRLFAGVVADNMNTAYSRVCLAVADRLLSSNSLSEANKFRRRAAMHAAFEAMSKQHGPESA